MFKKLLCSALLPALFWADGEAAGYAPLAKGEPLPQYVTASLPSQGALKFNPRQFGSRAVTGKQASTAIPMAADASRAAGLRGQLVYANSWPSVNAPTGLYTVPVTPDGEFSLIINAPLFGGQGVDNGQGIFYGTHTFNSFGMTFVEIISYDTDTWEQIGTPQASNYKMIATAVALDPSTSKIYGSYYSAEQNVFEWGEADYEAGERNVLGSFTIDKRPIALGATRDGQFYAVNASGEFGTIDKTNGRFTVISDTGLGCDDWVSGCVDDAAGKFIFHYHGAEEASLYDIDLATGAVSKLTEFSDGQQILCLYIPQPAAADKAPATPGFTVTCPQGAMKADYSIAFPSTLFDGTAAEGTMTYSVLVDDEEAATGSGQAGTTVTGTIDIARRGSHKFVCRVANDAGRSPKAKTETFIGFGTPLAPSNVNLVCADGELKLSWNPVTEASDEGYINPADVRYNIYEGETLVVKETSDCSYSRALGDEGGYLSFCFSVEAVNGDRKSEAVLSNNLGVGGVQPPYLEDFTDADTGFVFLDANNDKRTWSSYELDGNGVVRYSSGWSGSADDWAFTPGIILEAGKSYDFSFKAWCQNSWTSEELEVKLGTGLTVKDMTVTLMPKTKIKGVDKSNPKVVTATIVVKETAVYNVGFHITTYSDDGLNLYIDDVAIGAGQDAPVPDEIEELAIIADPAGEPKAEISFRIPSKWLSGEILDDEVSVLVERDDTSLGTFKGNNGDVITLSDQVQASGTYTYRFTPMNFSGKAGKVTEVKAYIGAVAPETVPEISVAETDVPGNVAVSWAPVTADENGKPLDGANVSYMLYTLDSQTGSLRQALDAPVRNTSVELQALENPELQDLVYFYVSAFNRDVESRELRRTNIITVGKPYPLPLAMSFDQQMLQDLFMGNENTNNGTWGIYNEAMFEDVKAQDGDGAFAACYGRYVGNSADLFSGKVDLADAANPCVTFWMYCFGQEDLNEITVSVLADGVKTPVRICSNTDINEAGWHKVYVSLKAFRGKTVQVYFTGRTVTNKFTFLDNVRILDMAETDLAVSGIEAVEEVIPSVDFEITAKVANIGYSKVKGAKVSLLADGEVVDSRELAELPADAETTVVFLQRFSVLDNGSRVYAVEAVAEGEANEADNRSEEITVSRGVSGLTAVTGLTGESHQLGAIISWNPVTPAEGETHVGYNVYCDNALLNPYPLSSPLYVDTDAADGNSRSYRVSALYKEGESELSAPFMFTYSGVESVGSDMDAVYVIDGLNVKVNVAAGVSSRLIATDGKTVASVSGPGMLTAPCAGTYLLQISGTTCKITLR